MTFDPSPRDLRDSVPLEPWADELTPAIEDLTTLISLIDMVNQHATSRPDWDRQIAFLLNQIETELEHARNTLDRE